MTRHARAAAVSRRERLWRWAVQHDLAARYAHGNSKLDDRAVMWGMLCHAIRVSARADAPPPRSGYPSASPGAWLAPDEVTWWQRVAAALRGETEEVEPPAARAPHPDATEIALRDEVLEVWHGHALRGLGDWRRIRRAVYALAAGVPGRKVQAESGLSRDRLKHARARGIEDLLAAWRDGR
ncbi:hypothetical protein SAMN05216257_104103 [Meinhardsimonia xiamenensis]|jgi:hypothetical protein|uniref:Uncharacterized protein n=1 Tax=Meinhardsimonia xiamenensis TaxID=990712 RepID=A0A1G9E0U2_9RHOB|nr:hypothetical protein [Meinhardsimonia xiamenensis]PRX33972.1 hypothetical protein LV81_02411 [Meinhardsimonia xiamenensis]SDK69713.1 hypothetical protein SAMN05216257_104103 [Meinhardsimonia xiamenensis]